MFLQPLTPILVLLLLFIINRFWLWKAITPVAIEHGHKIMRWRIVGHFYNLGAIYKMLQELMRSPQEDHARYQRMMWNFMWLQLLTFAALIWTVLSLVEI